ncbi:MAG: type I-MYXAN CRISPR-associated protein Cas6/Cmx6 [Planctomycetota bacterium]|nr:MAG: type I-MYXAN CRISPR-associated protein Cas6/Cmx6 [Planctomycetota bacterium]
MSKQICGEIVMDKVDLVFPTLGSSIPVDHGYPLYSALARPFPVIHHEGSDIQFCFINGEPAGEGKLRLTSQSCFRLRLGTALIHQALALANKLLDISGHKVRLGAPNVSILAPAARLYSRFVTIKNNVEPESFLAKVRERLTERNLEGEASIPVHESGPRLGEFHRKVMRIGGKSIVGYPLVLAGLNDEDSIRLQAEGIGGRQRIGAGFFLAVREKQSP